MKTNQKRPAVFTRSAVALLLLLVVGVLVTLATPFRTAPAEAAVNSTVNFQARLMSNAGSIVADGNYNVEFKIYNALSSSGSSQGSCTGDAACLWTETRITADKVSVANGYLTVDLGSVTALPNIDWSQNLYLGMRIGGTGSPGWDPEMSPRLHLTAVPYAFTAGKLQGLSNSNAVSLSFASNFGQPSAITLPDPGGASATVCYQNATNCGFATGTGSTAYIQNQNASAQTSSNFWISNTGIADVSLLTPLLDTPSGTTTLNIGTTNATAGISIKQSTSIVTGKTFNVFGDTTFAPTSGSTNAFRVQNSSSQNVLRVDSTNSAVLLGQANRAGSLFISDGGASGNSLVLASSGMQTSGATRTITLNGANLTAGRTYTLPDANGTFCMQASTNCSFAPTTGGTGYIQNTTTVQTATYAIRSGAIGNVAAVIQGANGQTADMLRLQTWNGSTATSVAVINNVGALALSGTGTNVFTTPVGASVNTKISIAPYAVGASAQIVSVGLTSGADTTSNGIAVYDARSSAHRASIAVYSPNESETIGMSWNGSNTSAYLQTLSHTAGTATAALILQSGDVAGGTGNSGDVTLQSGATAGATGQQTGSISIKSGTTTNTNGSTGGVTIDSGAKTGSGTAGSVSIGNTNAPTIVIGNTSSTTTVNGTLGVGATPSRKLDVYINDSVTTAAMARLLQAGTGDAALELNNSVRGYYLGVDTSDTSKFKISSSTANAATINVGYDSEGIGSPDSGNSALLNATQVTSSSTAGTATSVSVFFGNVSSQNVKMGLYTDNGSDQPGTLVASSAEMAAANGWNTLAISGSIAASTKYWVVFRISDNSVEYGHTNGVGKICFASVAYASAWPASFTPQGTCPITEHYTVYLTYTPAGAVDNFADSLFSLTDTGAATFKTTAATTSAFQITTSADAVVFNADATNSRVGIATAAPSEALTVNGNFNVRDADTATKQYRFRTSGFGLDFEAAGASLYMSGWTNADFTGTQQTWLIGSGATLTVGNGSGGSGGTNPTILVLDNKTSGTSDPSGTNGAMYYNTSLKAFRCHEDGVWHYCNDRRSMAWGYNIEEDFLGTDDGAFTFGELGWNETNSGTGADSWRTGAQDNRPGIIEQDTGTTTTGRSALYLGYASVDPTADTISITGGETIEFAFNLFQLSTAGQEFDSRIGLCDVVSGDCVDGIYFEYDRNSSTNWRIATSSNSSRTKTNTSTAVATGWTRFKIVVNSNATSITYYINDTSVGTIAATIPTGSSRQTCPMFQIIKSAGSSDVSQFIDYFAMYNSFTTPR